MIKVIMTFTEQVDKSVMTHIHSCDIGTGRETLFAMAAVQGATNATKSLCGDTIQNLHSTRIIKPVGGE